MLICNRINCTYNTYKVVYGLRCEACVILDAVTWGHYGCRLGLYAGLLFEGFWNHREVQQGPSSNNCSVLRGEAFPPPLTQQGLVLQPAKHLSAKLRGRGTRASEPSFGLQCGPGQCGERVILPECPPPLQTHRGASLQFVLTSRVHWQLWDPLKPLPKRIILIVRKLWLIKSADTILHI